MDIRQTNVVFFVYFYYAIISVCVFVCACVCVIVVFLFFHRLMSFKVQPCVILYGTNRKEARTQQEKESFTDPRTFEAIVCK